MARVTKGTKMKLTSMIALAVKWTINERTDLEYAKWEKWQEEKWEEWQEERYRYCLNQAIDSGDTNRYNKLLATHIPDC